MNGKKIITMVKYSCLTGKIVWVYHGRSTEGARKAYWRACKKEVRRRRQWVNKMTERRQRLMRIATDRDGDLAYGTCNRDEISSDKRKAMREIAQMCKTGPENGGEFYDHIIEEARQRNWRSGRWKANRERLFRYGKTNTPSEYTPKNK